MRRDIKKKLRKWNKEKVRDGKKRDKGSNQRKKN